MVKIQYAPELGVKFVRKPIHLLFARRRASLILWPAFRSSWFAGAGHASG